MRYAICIFIFLLLSCSSDSCREYSEFSCEEIEQAEYNVYFYFPSNTEQYLGHASNLHSCGSLAFSYAHQKDLDSNNEWSYICCMIANGSQCYEKHR